MLQDSPHLDGGPDQVKLQFRVVQIIQELLRLRDKDVVAGLVQFKRIDSDADKLIHSAEFAKAFTSVAADKRYREIFDFFDTDQDRAMGFRCAFSL